jgi:hypothetical protein
MRPVKHPIDAMRVLRVCVARNCGKAAASKPATRTDRRRDHRRCRIGRPAAALVLGGVERVREKLRGFLQSIDELEAVSLAADFPEG